MTGAGLILAAALSLGLAEQLGVLDGGMSERAMGVFIGAVLVVCGNSIPKTLKPLAQEKCEPASEQALRRFAGWTFVLAGLGYAIAWLVVPLEWANLVATLIAAAAVGLVAARVLRAVLPRKRIQPPAEL
jgi:dipeptide/tripeptide permease